MGEGSGLPFVPVELKAIELAKYQSSFLLWRAAPTQCTLRAGWGEGKGATS